MNAPIMSRARDEYHGPKEPRIAFVHLRRTTVVIVPSSYMPPVFPQDRDDLLFRELRAPLIAPDVASDGGVIGAHSNGD